MVTKQAETFLMGENKQVRSRCTEVVQVVRKRNDTNDLWYTIVIVSEVKVVRERRRLSPPTWEAAYLLLGHLFLH